VVVITLNPSSSPTILKKPAMIVKVVVTYPNTPPKEYEINRDQPYRGHVAMICSLFNINGNPNDYILQFQAGPYITEEVCILYYLVI